MFTDWKKKKIQLTDFHSLVELIADRLFDTHVNDFLDSFYFWCMRALQHYFACHYMKNWVRFLLFIYITIKLLFLGQFPTPECAANTASSDDTQWNNFDKVTKRMFTM